MSEAAAILLWNGRSRRARGTLDHRPHATDVCDGGEGVDEMCRRQVERLGVARPPPRMGVCDDDG